VIGQLQRLNTSNKTKLKSVNIDLIPYKSNKVQFLDKNSAMLGMLSVFWKCKKEGRMYE